MKKKVSVGISGINATDNPGPGVAVARSLIEARKDLCLLGLSYDVHDPGNYIEDLFKNTFLMPYPTHGWKTLLAAIQNVKAKSGLDVLIPCLDAELPLMIRHQSQLEKLGIQTLLPNEKQFELRSKDRLPLLSKEIRCLHPKTAVVNSLDELVHALKTEIPLPAVVKGKYYKAYMVHNLDSAILKGSEIAAEWGFPLLVQQVVFGHEINTIGLSDEKGNLVGRVSIKKQLTTHLGKVWTAVTIQDDQLDELCRRFCKATRWRGPFELECILVGNQTGSKNGIYLIEINPRFPAWVYFATAVGVNLPSMLVDLIQRGKCTKKLDYPLGKYLVRQTSEFVSDLSNFHNLLSTGNREGL
ncbi:MAG: carboxylate--amine ligase [Bdellovibrio sp.]|nr:carboxylate--amine ligase [Bdellovibrio sp.]